MGDGPAAPSADERRAAALLDALAADPEVRRVLGGEDAGSSLPRQLALAAVLALTLVVVGLFGAGVLFSFCGPMGFLPILLAGLGVHAVVRQAQKVARDERSPLERRIAVVLAVAADLAARGPGPARTRHRVTLLFADGSRGEVEADEEAADELGRGDGGVALLRAGRLAGFERFRRAADAP